MALSLRERRVSIDRHAGPLVGTSVRPFDSNFDDRGRVAKTDEHSRIVRGRVAAVGPGPAPERRTGRAHDAHSRAHGVAPLAPEYSDAHPMSPIADLIDQEPDRSAVV